MFGLSKSTKSLHPAVKTLYLAAMNQSRSPVLYQDYAVPDTMEGRFDSLLLHMFLIFHRLRDHAEYQKISQDLFDFCFADMDQALRENGIGDMGVPKRIKKMMMGFNGRMHAYDEALSHQDDAQLCAVLKRNLYADQDANMDDVLARMAGYVRGQVEYMAALDDAAILSGAGLFHEALKEGG